MRNPHCFLVGNRLTSGGIYIPAGFSLAFIHDNIYQRVRTLMRPELFYPFKVWGPVWLGNPDIKTTVGYMFWRNLVASEFVGHFCTVRALFSYSYLYLYLHPSIYLAIHLSVCCLSIYLSTSLPPYLPTYTILYAYHAIPPSHMISLHMPMMIVSIQPILLSVTL